mmetsp:Transcript_21016/g.51659  ORF Transcript_21016/g.51659 Transcript_21016/m.51659 type:complete len:81 (+) Transcript_21016:62-304(+)
MSHQLQLDGLWVNSCEKEDSTNQPIFGWMMLSKHPCQGVQLMNAQVSLILYVTRKYHSAFALQRCKLADPMATIACQTKK